MTDKKVTDLTELATPADDDLLHIVDVDNTTDNSAGSSFKVQKKNLRGQPVTTAETAAGVTPTNYEYAEGDVRRYGAVLDGSTNDSAALTSADSQATQGGAAIFIPRSASGMAIASNVAVVNDIRFDPGAFILYTGSAEEAALTLGVVTGSTASRRVENLHVKRNTQADWTNYENAGIRVLNADHWVFTDTTIENFTVGILAEGNDYGCANNSFFGGRILNARRSIMLTNDDTSLTSGYCNQNYFDGFRCSVNTGINSALSRVGIFITSERATPSLCNANTFTNFNIEMNASDSSSTAEPINVVYGSQNKFQFRDEGNDSPALRTDNASEWNVAEVFVNLTPTVSNDGTYQSNFAYSIRSWPMQRQNSSWHSGNLARSSNEYDGSNAVYIPGCSQRNSSNGNQAMALSSITVNDDYIDIANTRGVGIMVDTTIIKNFVFRIDAVSGRGGRLRVIPYDDNAAQLTTDGSYVVGTSDRGLTHSSTSGGSYATGSDSGADAFFSVTSDVKFIWVGIFGGTATARIRSFTIESVDGGAISAFQGYTDVNSDPFPNDLNNYATAVPANATAGPSYPAGKRLTKFNAAAGAEPGWICTTQGLGGTAVFKAEANVAA